MQCSCSCYSVFDLELSSKHQRLQRSQNGLRIFRKPIVNMILTVLCNECLQLGNGLAFQTRILDQLEKTPAVAPCWWADFAVVP